MAAVRLTRGGDSLSIHVSTRAFAPEVVLRAAYWLTDRYFVDLDSGESEVHLTLRSRTGAPLPDSIADELRNALVDQAMREVIGRETRPIREQIIRAALAECLPSQH